ncbi:MAG: YIP1 family protein [Anaerolineae bacterium]|nr:YIP1 family protein [Anaerolineae bacterium]
MSEKEAPQQEKRSVFKLLWGTLIHPKDTFSYLKNDGRKAWWGAAILILLLTLAPLIAGMITAQQQLAATMMGPEMMGTSEFSVEPMYEYAPPTEPEMPTGPNLFNVIASIPGTIISWLAWGGALYLASVFLGRSSNFGQMFRVAVWTWLPYAIRGVIQTLYILLTKQQIINAGLSGFIIDKGTTAIIPPGPGELALSSILGSIDLYLLWNLVLLIIGFMVFTNLPRKKALTAILTTWALFTLLSTLPAVIGGIFTGSF